ncbi:uncharacterized protein LOC105441140 [Strongylocentrotus purpuratus]|uniref:AP-4 complex accessory subunit Tepsin VHS/ENTH-like domain-containing protein n=1 Tax=Strongylocentrotus purpuratus TaxID=7668 RepID=A0A7M7HJH1_STRPU|nr:uncharacterized protein LOC105441140 [Strongylocentrotus purpuratus]
MFLFSRSSLLNCEKMIELLTSYLTSSYNTQLLCLFGIEGILKEDLISSDLALSLLSSHLTSLQGSQDKAIRAKSLKILRQLERLEADTSLDQPLIPESQLIFQSVLEAAEAEIPASSANTTPVKTVLPRDAFSSSDGAPKSSGGSLFSGMTVATRSPVAPGGKTSTGMSSSSASRHKEAKEGHSVADLLIDTQFMSKSDSSETNLLLSDTKPSSVTNNRTEGEFTQVMSAPAAYSLSNVNPGATPVHQKSVDPEASQHSRMDPIMSREAGFADLWNTVSPKEASSDPKASSNQVLSQLSTATPQVDMPSQHPHPSMTLQQPVMSAQHISQMYPQLSSITLSGVTSTPINLAKKPTTGFGFVVDNDDEKQKAGASRDAFSFIQDAMKNSKS